MVTVKVRLISRLTLLQISRTEKTEASDDSEHSGAHHNLTILVDGGMIEAFFGD